MVKRKQTKCTAVKADSSEDEVKSEIEYVFSESNGEDASDEDSEAEEEKVVKKKKKTLKKSVDEESGSNEDEISPSKKKKTKTKKAISKTQKDADGGDGDDDDDEIVGFADAISRILERTQIPVGKKHTILAKGKTDKEIQRHKLEKLLESNPEAVKEEIPDSKDHKEKLKEKKMKLLLARTKPNVLEINKERQLKAVATQGIVQLFNAVQKQQKLNEENENTINTTEWKKQKISENTEQMSFFHLLQNMPKVNLSSQPEDTIKPEPEKKIWNFLKNDFILDSTKMKDWDKKESV
ncbi:RRP15-like protein [Octopus bimaculoides]|uniref:RRP15-like protein n=1 Tax=Octopus bimaculoides TaxID=37653 RepID=A0A0L8GPB4_OCTBM|nr:RRP15-like protein [Octopus bimaculoides]|eukprot:XP_014779473.1 PREDICTED: RRP15-like protein [Octopus bimaculoides]